MKKENGLNKKAKGMKKTAAARNFTPPICLSSVLLVLFILSFFAIGFSTWSGVQTSTGLSLNVALSDITSKGYEYSVTAAMGDDTTVSFDAPGGTIDESRLNGVLTPVDGTEDLTFEVKLTFAPKVASETVTLDTVKSTAGLKAAFGFSGGTVSNADSQTTVSSWYSNNYISLPGGSSSFDGSTYDPSTPPDDGDSVKSILDGSGALNSSVCESAEWSSSGTDYSLVLTFSFSWGSFFDNVNPVYTSVEGDAAVTDRESLIAAVKEMDKSPVDGLVIYLWVVEK